MPGSNATAEVEIGTLIQSLVEEFERLPDWEARYAKIIEIGRSLSPMPESKKTEENKVRGCQSQVWLSASYQSGKVIFEADSDAQIVKGLIAVLLRVYNQRTTKEILSTPPDFIERLGLNTNLSQARTNGLVSMIKQIKIYALAFSAREH